MPADNQRSDDADAPEELKQILALRRQLAAAEEGLSARQTKMLDVVGKRDEGAERQKMMQAIRVELAQLKEDLSSSSSSGKR